MTSIHVYQYKVSKEDIDAQGHAGNYHYVRWMQLAAIAHSSKIGWSPDAYNELGAGWVVRSHKITYLKPAYRGNTVHIRTWVANMKSVTSLRRYEICDATGELLARAETDWAFINYKTQRPVRIPERVSSCFSIVPDADDFND